MGLLSFVMSTSNQQKTMHKLSDYINWARSLSIKELDNELTISFCPSIKTFTCPEQARDYLARHCYDAQNFFATYQQKN
jgi:hypothetical protein